MNKEQLIKLKKILFEKNSDEEYRLAMIDDNYYELSYVQTKCEILSNLNTNGAVQAIMKNFESAIKYYAKKNINFDTMTIKPFMHPYVSEKSLKQYLSMENDSDFDVEYCESNIMLKDDIKFLDDIVSIDLYNFFVYNTKQIVSFEGESESILNYDAYNRYIVSITDLKNKLLEQGLELKGVKEINDILLDNNKGSITIKFAPKKTKSKIRKK